MTGRCSGMAAARTSLRGQHRAVCTVAGVLVVLGILSGALAHGHATHHRSHAVTVATVTADGHGWTARGDQHLVATSAVTTAQSVRWAGSVAAPAASASLATIDSVRTRGPPATA